MDLHHKREIAVGTVVLAAIAAFILGTMWLRGHSLTTGELVKIQFADVGNLKEASSVRVSGVDLGKVQELTFVEPGKVIVAIAVDPRVHPRIDASARIVTLSLAAGDAAVALDPGRAREPLPPGRIIIGQQDPGFTDIAGSLASRADSVLIGAQELVSAETVAQLRTTMTALQGTLAAAEQTMRVYSNPNRGPTAELTQTMQQFRSVGARLDSTLSNPGLQRALSTTDTLTSNLAAMSAQLTATGARLDSLLARVGRGEGTIGKFATDSALYLNVVKLTARMDTVLQVLQKNPGKIPITVRLF
jgi:phospholipid/cholesterol/gamma-HCH transport system substrate-binding protein